MTTTTMERSRMTTGIVWTLQIATAAIFLMAGSTKLIGAPDMVQAFEAIGIGQWFRYLTGAIEVVSAILLLIPSLALFGAAALALTMVGAVIAHVFILGGGAAMAIILLAATVAIVGIRKDETWSVLR